MQDLKIAQQYSFICLLTCFKSSQVILKDKNNDFLKLHGYDAIHSNVIIKFFHVTHFGIFFVIYLEVFFLFSKPLNNSSHSFGKMNDAVSFFIFKNFRVRISIVSLLMYRWYQSGKNSLTFIQIYMDILFLM